MSMIRASVSVCNSPGSASRKTATASAREVARDPDSSLDGDDVEEAKHRRAAVLNLHDLVPAHVAGLDETERVVDAQRREHADVALREHLDLARAWRGSTVALNCKRSE